MTLYLGLDPSRYPDQENITHYPVIRTEKIIGEDFARAKKLWPSFTHVIFTSKQAVSYWFENREKELSKIWIAIGPATAASLQKLGLSPLVAKEPTQEGVISLLKDLDLEPSYLLIPHSKKSRPDLIQFLQRRKIEHFSLELYDTHFQKTTPIPQLENFEKIVFTSPSTVDAFLEIYGAFPKGKHLIAIGPVTEKALKKLI